MQELMFISLLVGGVLLLNLALWLSLNRQSRKLKQIEQDFKALVSEQHAILSSSLGLGRKLHLFKSTLAQLEQSQDEIRLQDSTGKSIEQAAKMFKQGIPIMDIVESCHISLGEAELLQQMVSSKAH